MQKVFYAVIAVVLAMDVGVAKKRIDWRDDARWAQGRHAAYRYIFAHEGSSYETYIRLLTLHQRKVLGALASVGGAHVNSNDFLDAAGCHNASSVKKALERLV